MKAKILFILKWVISLGALFFAWKNMSSQGSGSFLENFRKLNLGLFCLALCFNLFSFVAQTVQWKVLLERQGIKQTFFTYLKLFFNGLFYNFYLPGNIAGEFKKVYELKKKGEAVAGVITATLTDKIFGLFVINTIGLVTGLIWFRQDSFYSPLIVLSAWIFLVMLAFFVSVYSCRVERVVLKLLQFSKLKWLQNKYHNLSEHFQKYHSKAFFTKLFALSLTIQMSRIIAQYIMVIAMGLHVPLYVFFFFVPILGIVSSLPISIGGFGLRELLAQNLFKNFGLLGVDAFWMQIWVHLTSMICALPGILDLKKAPKETLEEKEM